MSPTGTPAQLDLMAGTANMMTTCAPTPKDLITTGNTRALPSALAKRSQYYPGTAELVAEAGVPAGERSPGMACRRRASSVKKIADETAEGLRRGGCQVHRRRAGRRHGRRNPSRFRGLYQGRARYEAIVREANMTVDAS